MYRAKKIFATMLVGVLLLGFAITAYASENILREPPHQHEFSQVYTIYKSQYMGTHPHMIGWKVDASTGERTPAYVTCYLSVDYYKGEWKCGCGATNGPCENYSEERHYMPN